MLDRFQTDNRIEHAVAKRQRFCVCNHACDTKLAGDLVPHCFDADHAMSARAQGQLDRAVASADIENAGVRRDEVTKDVAPAHAFDVARLNEGNARIDQTQIRFFKFGIDWASCDFRIE